MEQVPKYRNIFLQVVLFFITLGIYGVYWYYSTAEEMKQMTNDGDASPGLWTVLMFLPVINFYAMWMYSSLFEKASGEKSFPAWVMFLLFVFLTPVVWIIVQLDLNRKADEALRSRVYA